MPRSMTRPSSISRIRSARRIVDSRCAMTNVVRPGQQRGHRRLNQLLALRVEVARRLVQDQNLRRRQDGPRDCQALALAARQLHAALADERLVLLGQPHDELVRVRTPRGVLDLGVRRLVPAVGDVVAHRAVEQKHILLHDREQRAIRCEAEIADVRSVEEDAARESDRGIARRDR